MTKRAEKIESFLRISLNHDKIFVSDARPKNEGQYEYAIFLNEKNYKGYVSNKNYSEDIIIFKEGEKFGFEYQDSNYQPKENFKDLLSCIKKIAEEIFFQSVNQAVKDFSEDFE
jgi:hypothetical protein